MEPVGGALPERLGRYEILVPIGAGGMASVYLARAEGAAGFQREVALKLVHPHLSEHPELSRELLEEAKLAGRIRHPNVVAVLDAGDVQGHVFLVMEYVEGDTLSALVRASEKAGATLPVPVALRVLADALLGLHVAHELRDDSGAPLDVVHRDFSPQNVLVGVDGLARLTDFGIAKAAGRARVTKTGLVRGKVGYMAPEQARGERLDRRCDVWAAGVVAWELFAGRRMLDTEEEVSALLKIVTEDPPRLRDVRPEVPAAVDEAVHRALRRDREARLSSVDELRELLVSAWKRPAEASEVSEMVTRLVGPRLAERRRRVEDVTRARAGRTSRGRLALAGAELEAEAPVTHTRAARAARRVGVRVAIGGGAAAGAVLAAATMVALTRSPPVSAQAEQPAPTPRETATVAPSEPAPPSSPAAPEGSPTNTLVAPTPTAPAILVLEANAPIASVRVGDKVTAVARPATRVTLPVEESARERGLSLVVVATDGRRVDARATAGTAPVVVAFAPRTGPRPPAARPAPSPSRALAPSPYASRRSAP